jgi:hypothetical protein
LQERGAEIWLVPWKENLPEGAFPRGRLQFHERTRLAPVVLKSTVVVGKADVAVKEEFEESDKRASHRPSKHIYLICDMMWTWRHLDWVS